jgi:hypothetical protein
MDHQRAARIFEALRTLLDDLTGTARLTTLEDQVEVTQLKEPLTALRRVVGKYPVRP